MKRAGIREVRQQLSTLLAEVKAGHEIVITDRGRPVARLLPPAEPAGRAFPDLSAFRRAMPKLKPPLSSTIVGGRDDRF